MNLYRYNYVSEYLKNKFGERTLKICVDGNFTCPNRDGTKSTKGCIFCSEKGSGEHIKFISIKEQIKNHLDSYKGTRANKFIVYFQNFTNTYDSINNLKEKYDSSLIDDRIVGLEIATRPDCISDDICKLLASYKNKYYVSVELGLQTTNENTGNLINRCYTNEDFINACNMLHMYDIPVVTHLMLGLPNETDEDIQNMIDFVNKLPISGIKIHSTYIVSNTVLNDLYSSGKYLPITLDYYLEKLEFIITHLRPDIIIHRLNGDAPKDILVAPEWNLHKKWVLNGINKRLKENNLYQGIYYSK